MVDFRNLANILPGPVLFLDEDGSIVFSNEAFRNLTGLNNDGHQNLKIFDFLPETDRFSFRERLQQVGRNFKSQTVDLNLVTLANQKIIAVNATISAEKTGKKFSGYSFFISEILNDDEAHPTIINLDSQAISEIEEKYQTVFDLAFEGLIIHRNGLVLDANAAFENMLGYTREELIGVNIVNLCVLPEYHKLTYDAMKSEITSAYEVMARRKDGTIIYTQVESRRVRLNNEKVRLTAIRDVTSRKLAEIRLKESEERFRLLSNITFEGIFLHDKGIIVDANRSLARMIGYELGEIIGKNIIDLVVLPEYHERVAFALDNEETTPYEVRARRKDGSVFFAEVEAGMVNHHGRWLRVTAARDITWRKQAEKKLRENEEELDTFFSQSGDGFFIMNLNKPVRWDDKSDKDKKLGLILKNMKLTKLNEAMAEQYRTSVSQILGYTLEQLFEWNDVFGRKFIRELLDKGHVKFEMAEPRFDHSIMWVEGNYVVLYDENGKVRGCCGVRRDISSRKQAEELIQRHNEELKKTNQELDNFVYRVSHDLKAPISSARGLINIAQKENEISRIRTCLELIDESMNKLDSFILDILDYSRNSRLGVEPKLIDFEQLIKDTLFHTKYLQLERNIETEFEIIAGVDFYSDLRRLVFVFNNLTSNAIRFSDDHKKNSYLKISVEITEAEAHIRFMDNGIGIKPEHVENIFQMFYRATEERVGSGLGLYIVKESLEKLGGNISVSSEFGIGTTFDLTIPNLMHEAVTKVGG